MGTRIRENKRSARADKQILAVVQACKAELLTAPQLGLFLTQSAHGVLTNDQARFITAICCTPSILFLSFKAEQGAGGQDLLLCLCLVTQYFINLLPSVSVHTTSD